MELKEGWVCPTLVAADRPGQLGNQMMVLAHLIATALEFQTRVWAPGFKECADNLQYFSGDSLCRYPGRGRRRYRLPGIIGRIVYFLSRVVSAALVRVPFSLPWIRITRLSSLYSQADLSVLLLKEEKVRLHLLQGWLLRNKSALIKHIDSVRQVLQPRQDVVDEASALIEQLRGTGAMVIGLHVRRGDYQRHQYGRYFFSLEDYRAIGERALALWADRNAVLLVCSDEPVPPEVFRGIHARISTGNAIFDLTCLSLCDAVVGPPSSFTMIASLIGSTPLYSCENANALFSRDDFRVIPATNSHEVRVQYGL
jgi:hypothetical protein